MDSKMKAEILKGVIFIQIQEYSSVCGDDEYSV